MTDYTAADLVARLRKRYASRQEYSVLEQVADGTGAYTHSWIDAVVLSLWPSNGLWRAAFEVKVSRADFLREVTNPAKNAWARQYHHQFWFVAPAACIKGVEELPEGAGWLKPHGDDGLQIVRAATLRPNPTTDDTYIAALARSLQKDEQRVRADMRDDILKTDREVAAAMMWEVAGKRFLHERGGGRYVYPKTADEAFAELCAVNKDQQAEEEREQIKNRCDQFQRKMLDLFDAFCGVAHVGLLERDELGRLLGWGAEEEGVKRRSKRDHDATEKARQAARIRLIMGNRS